MSHLATTFPLVAACCAAMAVVAGSASGVATPRLTAVLPPPRRGAHRGGAIRLAARVAGACRPDRLRRRRSEAATWHAEVIELCAAFAGELATGQVPAEALSRAVRGLDPPVARALAPVAAAARFGGDVAAHLDQAARRPGADGLRLLAVGWRVGVERGAALGPIVDGLATMLRDEEACRAEVRAQLAGPRATAALLAALPALALPMAAALGARPLAFLFGSVPGAACLVAAVSLEAVGLWWVARIMRAAVAAR